MAQVVKNPPANAGATGSIPGWGISPGGGNDNPPQYSFPDNPMDRGAWWVTVRGVAERNMTEPALMCVHLERNTLYFPGGPMAKTPPFQSRGCAFDPCLEN